MKKITITATRFPNEVPKGIPPLPHPWLAYVGNEHLGHLGQKGDGQFWVAPLDGEAWIPSCGAYLKYHRAIDVRTEFAKKYFPELVAAMEYEEPSPIAKGHNPAQLTEKQVGVAEGWRLLDKEEVGFHNDNVTGFIEAWVYRWSGWLDGYIGQGKSITYRTQKPEGYFLPKPTLEPLLSKEEISAIKILFPRAKYVAWDMNGDAYIFGNKPSLGHGSYSWVAAKGESPKYYYYVCGLDGRAQKRGLKWEDSCFEIQNQGGIKPLGNR